MTHHKTTVLNLPQDSPQHTHTPAVCLATGEAPSVGPGALRVAMLHHPTNYIKVANLPLLLEQHVP